MSIFSFEQNNFISVNCCFSNGWILAANFFFFSMYSYADLINMFEVFIPQLHLYRNPNSLLNGKVGGGITQLYYSYSKSERQSSFSI